MLTLVMGADRAVLSCKAFDAMKKAADAKDGGWVLIVPEQFSFEAERRLCQVGGDRVGRFAEVLSFSRFSDRVAARQGGIAVDYLDKGGQLLTMALAAEQVASRIKLYASVLRKPEFLSDMVRIVGEFKSYCLQPDALFQASRKAEGQFAQKLEEIVTLYEAYLAVCANSKADPADKLLRLAASLEECDWLHNMKFYFDGFSDFTGIELRILEILICCANEVYISVPTGPDGSVIHHVAQKNARQLQLLAQRSMVECQMKIVQETVSRHEDVAALLHKLFLYGGDTEGASDAIELTVCPSVEAECRYCAQSVSELLMKGVRCRDVSVACTDIGIYEVPLRNAFRAAGIPAYFAGERGVLSKPIICAVMNSVFAAAGAMEYEDVELYLKSGLPIAERERCDRLSSYAYVWNIKGSRWESTWKFHPRGFGETMTEDDLAYLDLLNHDREEILKPLLELRRRLQHAKDTGQMITSVYDFLEQVELRRRLEEKANAYAQQGMGQTAQELVQLYEILLQSLEQMWLTVGDTVRSADDFCRLYQTVLTQYEVATIPAGLDQVHVSDLPDLRNKSTEHLFVLGASDGSFPSYKTSEGLLTEEDRIKLLAQGLSVSPGRADQLDQELCKIYFALSAAEESVHFSYCGEQPAWLFRRAAAMYPKSVRTLEVSSILNAKELAALAVRSGEKLGAPDEEMQSMRDELSALKDYAFTPLKAETVRKLHGATITLSPSKIDKYAACRFAFFMNYGLRARPRKQAKLDQPAFGTFVHAVLENTVLRVNQIGGFHVVTKEKIIEIASEEITRYAEEFFPEQAKREAYLFARSKAEIREIVIDVWEELRRSRFVPAFCELKFTGGEDLPAVEIKTEHGACKVIGMVDRVDLFSDGDKTYVRVVDYKTGVKDFDYTDILNGAGLQMLIYLFGLQSAGKQLADAERLEPAGVLYHPAKKTYPLTGPMPEDAFVEEKHRDLRKRKGLIRSDDVLLAAMEEDPENPAYMPYYFGRGGVRKGDLATAHQMKLLEHHVTRTIAQITDQIVDGAVSPNPVIRGQYGACSYCDYKTICHKDLGTHEQRVFAKTSAELFWEKLEQEEENDG